MLIINPKYDYLNITKYLVEEPVAISSNLRTTCKYFKSDIDVRYGKVLTYSKYFKKDNSTISIIDGDCPSGYVLNHSGYEHVASQTSLFDFAVIYSTLSLVLCSIQTAFILTMNDGSISHATSSVITVNSIIGSLLLESKFRPVDKFYDWVTVCEEDPTHTECLVEDLY